MMSKGAFHESDMSVRALCKEEQTMKKHIFLTAFFLSLMTSTMALAEDDNPFSCNEGTGFTYHADGSVTVTTPWWGETEYESLEDALEAVFGFVPDLNIENSKYNNIVPNAPSNNSSSVKQRGRLIYTVREATELSKPTGNKFRLRYK